MIHTFEMEDNKEIKAIVYARKEKNKEHYEVMGVKGVTQEELEKIIAQLWTAINPSKN